MKLFDLVDRDVLAAMVEGGYVSVRGSGNLTLYGYTAKCQYDRMWNPTTEVCRGLIAWLPDGEVVARPFRKFFNLGELEQIPAEPFEVFEKVDGSLIIAFTDPATGRTRVATRGSFESEQAKAAQTLIDERYDGCPLPRGETWLFEFVAPWNRIVVDYGDRTDLVALCRVHNESGAEFFDFPGWSGPVVKRHPCKDLDVLAWDLETMDTADAEGFVIRFASGLRAKAKFSEYVRLHRILTQCSSRTIWEYLSQDRDINALVERVPDEFYDWVRSTVEDLTRRFAEIGTEAFWVAAPFLPRPEDPDEYRAWKKRAAATVSKSRYPGVVFAMLDGKPTAPMVWRMVEPAYERPFKEVEAE